MNIRMSETSCRLLNNARTKGVAPDVEDDMQVYGCQIQRGDTVQERIRGGRTYIYSYDCKTREHVHVDRIQFIDHFCSTTLSKVHYGRAFRVYAYV